MDDPVISATLAGMDEHFNQAVKQLTNCNHYKQSCKMPAFCAWESAMWVWLLLPLVFAGGYFLGWWQNKRWRYQRIIIARLRFQAIALSVETLSLRNKVVSQGSCNIQPAKRKLVRKRPTIAFWKRRLIAWLRLKWPWLTKFMRFSPMTYINWQKAKARSKHHDKILAGKDS